MSENRIPNMDCIVGRLKELRDEGYRDFHARLLPTVDPARIIGVRTPDLRRLAREVARDDDLSERFLAELPHRYYEENNLHGALLCLRIKDIDRLLAELDRFLPHVDNWATCDMLSPKLFARHPDTVERKIAEWLRSGHVYTVRFGVVSLLGYYLDERFRPEHFEWLRSLEFGEYYIDMAVAWYFSFALIKQWDAALPIVESYALDKRVHNMTIQKAVDSFRITPERKDYLRSLRRK